MTAVAVNKPKARDCISLQAALVRVKSTCTASYGNSTPLLVRLRMPALIRA